MGGGLRPVRGAEGVHHEDIAQRGVSLRQSLVVVLFPAVEAHVLKQHHLTGGDLDAVAPGVDEAHLATE